MYQVIVIFWLLELKNVIAKKFGVDDDFLYFEQLEKKLEQTVDIIGFDRFLNYFFNMLLLKKKAKKLILDIYFIREIYLFTCKLLILD